MISVFPLVILLGSAAFAIPITGRGEVVCSYLVMYEFV